MPTATQHRRRALGPALIALAALTAACAQPTATTVPAPEGTAVTPPPLPTKRIDKSPDALIAVLAPLSAPDARLQEIAQGLVDAAQLAITDINDPRIRVRQYDTGGDPQRAANAAQTAIADGADIIVGPVFGAAAKTVGPVARQSAVNVITFSTDSTAAAENVFLIGSLPNGEVARILSYASSQGLFRIAGFAPEGPYGDQVVASMRDGAFASGVTVEDIGRYGRTFELIQASAQSFATPIAAPRLDPEAQNSANPPPPPEPNPSTPDAILIPDSGFGLQTAASFLAYFDAGPPDVTFIGTGLWNDEATLREATLKGGLFPAPDPTFRALFAERYRTVFGVEPAALAELGYDAVAAVGAMLAFAEPGEDPFDTASVTDPRGFEGVTGVFRFTPDGLNERGYAILEVTGEGFIVRDPAPRDFSGAGL